MERDNNTFHFEMEEQEKVVFSPSGYLNGYGCPWDCVYNFIEVDLPLSREIVKRAEVEYYNSSEEFVWEYISVDRVVEHCSEETKKYLEEEGMDYVWRWAEEAYGEFELDGKWIDFRTYKEEWNKDNNEYTVIEPHCKPEWYPQLAKDLEEFLDL